MPTQWLTTSRRRTACSASELAGGGETVPVAGVEKLEPGTYEFLCEPHPNMKGTLQVR